MLPTQQPLLRKLKPNWFLRYKLYHLPFWFVYHYLNGVLIKGSASGITHMILHSPYAVKFLFYVVLQAFAVYFNLYYLIPKFLERGKYVQYIGILICTIAATSAFIVTGYYATALFSDKTFQELFNQDPQNFWHFFTTNSLPSTIASMTLAMSVKLTKNWVQTKAREKELEKEKLETELKFLKAQVNPHFLFNTINSIFVLIHKNPHMASEALAKFSDLLRYQLYECNEHEIPLDQELAYLQNFMELEKLRLDSGQVEFSYTCTIDAASNLTIAPFLLLPFIENAFKHVSKEEYHPNWINLELNLQQNNLQLLISNSSSMREKSALSFKPYGGIGLQNVQRRLNLVYPGEHQLKIQQSEKAFHVELSILLRTGASYYRTKKEVQQVVL